MREHDQTPELLVQRTPEDHQEGRRTAQEREKELSGMGQRGMTIQHGSEAIQGGRGAILLDPTLRGPSAIPERVCKVREKHFLGVKTT